jgi:hypothetical protein
VGLREVGGAGIFDELDRGTSGSLDRPTFQILFKRATALDNYHQFTEGDALEADRAFDMFQKNKEDGVSHSGPSDCCVCLTGAAVAVPPFVGAEGGSRSKLIMPPRSP